MNSYSSAVDGNVFVGVWTDYSRPSGLRTTLTLDIQYARYVISATSVFITMVGSCVWSIISFFVHKRLATKENADGFLLDLRILYRNAGSELSTLWAIQQILQAWRKSKLRPVAEKVKRRAVIFSFPPLLNVMVFAALSILGAKVAGSDYQSNHVLLKSGNCGSIIWNSNLTASQQFQSSLFQRQMALNETQAARLYAHNCYQPGSRATQCSVFPTKSVPYSTDLVSCPFGLDSAGNSLCLPENNMALEYSTPLLDTDAMFGINAAVEKRIQIRKSLTCSPIRISEYVRTVDQGFPNATTYLDMGPVPGVSDYTFAYTPRSKNDSVGYQLLNFVPGGGAIWSPVDALKASHGDVSINVLTSNSIHYLEPVKDLWFAANTLVVTCYAKKVCNPNHNPSSCTILGSGNDIFESYTTIGLNKYQTVSAIRLGQVLPMTSTFIAVNALGSSSLLASTNVASLVSLGLPPDQWQREVKDWFETGLAAMQAGVVQWANNNLDPGIFGHIVHPDPKVQTLPASYFCGNQRVRNTGQYVSFSFLGLMIILCVGVPLILLSWFIEDVDKLFRKLKDRLTGRGNPAYTDKEIVRIADQNLQLLRKALCGSEGNADWDNLLKTVPTTRGDRKFPLPKLIDLDGTLDYYFPTKESEVKPGDSTKDEELRTESRNHSPKLSLLGNTEEAAAEESDEPEEKAVVSTTTHEIHGERTSPSPQLSPPIPAER